MDAKYQPTTPAARLGHLIEEAGEVVSAAGKVLRFGLDSANPELPEEEQVTNRDWLLAEMEDLERAIAEVRRDLTTCNPCEAHEILRDEYTRVQWSQEKREREHRRRETQGPTTDELLMGLAEHCMDYGYAKKNNE